MTSLIVNPGKANLLSPAAFGGYIRLILKLSSGEGYFTLPQLCRVFAAATLEETREILNEIVDSEILQYTPRDRYHYFVSTEMKKAAQLSQVRSAAGKLGAAKTNSKK